jgi:hypothetical protein
MTSQAYAQRERIRTAASAGRLLVPTRSLPDTMDIPRPFAPLSPIMSMPYSACARTPLRLPPKRPLRPVRRPQLSGPPVMC